VFISNISGKELLRERIRERRDLVLRNGAIQMLALWFTAVSQISPNVNPERGVCLHAPRGQRSGIQAGGNRRIQTNWLLL